MRRYIVLLLISGTVWAQTSLDKLVLKDGTEYLGEYSSTEGRIVYFKPRNALAFHQVPFRLIKTLQLKDETILIDGANLKLSLEKIDVYEAKNRIKITKYEKIDKYFVRLLTCSMIVVPMIYIITLGIGGGLGQSPGPIFTPPDA